MITHRIIDRGPEFAHRFIVQSRQWSWEWPLYGWHDVGTPYTNLEDAMAKAKRLAMRSWREVVVAKFNAKGQVL